MNLQQNPQVMLQLKIEDPDNFQFASTVTKDSKMGLTSNRRLLVVKGGHLYYYSSVPKSFDGDPKVLQYVHQLPKSSIDITKIKKLTTPSKTSPLFQIYFDNKHLMQRQDIRKTLTNENYAFQPKKDKEESVWRFTCDNHYIKQKWIGIIVSLLNYYNNQEEQIKKYFENLDGGSQERKSYMGKNTNSKNPWRESAVDRKQYSFDIKNLIDIEEKGEDQNKIEEFNNVIMKKNVKQHVAC